MKQQLNFLKTKWQTSVVALFMLLFSATSLHAQFEGETVTFRYVDVGLIQEIIMNYSGQVNGKCAFQNSSFTLEFNGTIFLVTNTATSEIYFSSTVITGVKASVNPDDWDGGSHVGSITEVYYTLPPFTAIPDANFEQALFDQGIDTVNGDHQVLTSAISGVTGLIIISANISDLTGIQDFTALQNLDCSNNTLTTFNASGLSNLSSLNVFNCSLTSLNVSGLSNLTSLECSVNSLTSLNVTGLSSLTQLYCVNNSITSLDVSGSSNLISFDCNHNQISSLNVSGLNQLTYLGLESNLLTTLNLSGLSSLTQLECGWNALTALNLSGLSNLTFLRCLHNQIATLNLSGVSNLSHLDYYDNQLSTLNVSGLSSLTYLNCGSNGITNINVSGLSNLNEFYCYSNNLTSLDISVLNPATTYFDCSNNPALTCITVSDVIAANNAPVGESGWSKDATANYSSNCGVVIPTSKVKANQCGATLSSLSANINADYVPNYQAYRFEVTNGATVNTVEVNKYNFSLTQTPGITYDTTFGVRVAVKIGGTWGAYGASCNVTTPALTSNVIPTTTIMPIFCGTTLAALNTKIGATPVYNASGYRFEISTGGITSVYDSAVYNFRLADAGVAAYGTTYNIRVAAQINGVYGNYGASCNVTTPTLVTNTVPITTILPSLCGTTLASKDAKITAVMVAGATNGRYEITKAGSAPIVYEVASTTFKLSQTGVVVAYNTEYTIRVAAFVGGVWGNYGASCTVTTPAAPSARLKAQSFEVSAYPNPFDIAFNLSLETTSKEDVTIAVYDMMGKLVETHQVNPMEVANLQIGNNFAAGIYNVIVSQANEMQAIRLIRK